MNTKNKRTLPQRIKRTTSRWVGEAEKHSDPKLQTWQGVTHREGSHQTGILPEEHGVGAPHQVPWSLGSTQRDESQNAWLRKPRWLTSKGLKERRKLRLTT